MDTQPSVQKQTPRRRRSALAVREIWAALADYANAVPGRKTSSWEPIRQAIFDLLLAGPGRGIVSNFGLLPEEHVVAKEQPHFRRFLRWLCDPKNHRQHEEWAVDFLNVHANKNVETIFSVQLERYEDDRGESFKMKGADPRAGHLCAISTGYRNVLDPICVFIVDRYRRFITKEINYDEFLPVRTCRKKDCGRFFVPERIGNGDYCSARCRIISNRPSRKEFADYKWALRLKNEPPGTRRRKLRTPDVKKRLDNIVTRWPQRRAAELARELLV